MFIASCAWKPGFLKSSHIQPLKCKLKILLLSASLTFRRIVSFKAVADHALFKTHYVITH